MIHSVVWCDLVASRNLMYNAFVTVYCIVYSIVYLERNAILSSIVLSTVYLIRYAVSYD